MQALILFVAVLAGPQTTTATVMFDSAQQACAASNGTIFRLEVRKDSAGKLVISSKKLRCISKQQFDVVDD